MGRGESGKEGWGEVRMGRGESGEEGWGEVRVGRMGKKGGE